MEQQTEKTGDEEANLAKAEALGIEDGALVPGTEEVELVSGLNMGFGEEAKAAAAEEDAAVAAKLEEPEEIQIGDKTFNNQKDAIAYAKKLDGERLANDAYRQGIQDTIGTEKVTPVASEPNKEEVENLFYDNPTEYIAKITNKARSEAKEEILAEIRQERATSDLWTTFYNKNPNLKSKDKLVKTILAENMAMLGNMTDHDKAMTILAGKVKSQLKEWADEDMPKQELANVHITSGGGSQSEVTSRPVKKENLDFVSQMIKHQEDKMI
jgi:hypothetical protein